MLNKLKMSVKRKSQKPNTKETNKVLSNKQFYNETNVPKKRVSETDYSQVYSGLHTGGM